MKGRNTGYNPALHRKSRLMHKFTRKERTERKKAHIMDRQALRDGKKTNMFGGLLNFIDALKKRKKEKNSAADIDSGRKGQHQRQAK